MRMVKRLKNLKDAGNNSFKEGNLEEAVSKYTEALDIDSLNHNINSKLLFNRATMHTKLGNQKECIKDCTSALENDPYYIKALLRRAKTYKDINDLDNAINDYERAFSISPQDSSIKELLKEVKLERKKLTRKDYYKILGVDTKANINDIKKAYRIQAMKHHPDKHADDSDEEKKKHELMFKDIGEAYTVLSDIKQREVYDCGDDPDESEWDVDEDGNIDSEAIWQQLFGDGSNTSYVFL